MSTKTWDEMTARERDALVHERVMGISPRTVPEEQRAKYGANALDDAGSLWTDIVTRAIEAEVVLEEVGYYKGAEYEAVFDGWNLYYHLAHEDSYRAPESIRLTGTPDEWRGFDGLIIIPAKAPHYSTDIAAAWRVVVTMRERHGVLFFLWEAEDGVWGAMFSPTVKPDDGGWIGEGATAPEAICRAALAALEKAEA